MKSCHKLISFDKICHKMKVITWNVLFSPYFVDSDMSVSISSSNPCLSTTYKSRASVLLMVENSKQYHPSSPFNPWKSSQARAWADRCAVKWGIAATKGRNDCVHPNSPKFLAGERETRRRGAEEGGGRSRGTACGERREETLVEEISDLDNEA